MPEETIRFTSQINDISREQDVFSPLMVAVNRNPWRGYDAGTCKVTNCHAEYTQGQPSATLTVDVTYRTSDVVTFLNSTRYHGWKVAVPLVGQDGRTFVDNSGNPLPDGAPPIYDEKKIYGEVDYNAVSFPANGKVITPSPVPHISKQRFDKDIEQVMRAPTPGFRIGNPTGFAVPRRSRPFTKIVLSDAQNQIAYDGFGTRLILVNNDTAQLEARLMEEILKLVCDFLEGRVMAKSHQFGERVLIEIDDALVDCTPNQYGSDTWFGVFKRYTPATFMEELAKRLMSLYLIHVTVVDGPGGGLLVERESLK